MTSSSTEENYKRTSQKTFDQIFVDPKNLDTSDSDLRMLVIENQLEESAAHTNLNLPLQQLHPFSLYNF